MKAAQRQFLVRVTDVEGNFATMSGGNVTSSASKVYDGGSLDPDVLSSPSEAEDITVGRPFDPYRDGPILRDLRRRVGRFRATVSKTPTDEDLIPIDEPTVYAEALLIGVNEPQMDASSGDVATFELTFAVGSWK